VPSGKQPINGRRPAIPTDLFAAWFEENEPDEPEASTLSTAEVEPLAPQSVHAPVSAPAEQEVAVPTASVAPAADDTEATPVVESVELVAESGEPTEVQAPSIVLSKEDERFCRKLERIVNARMRNPNLNIDVIAAQFGIGRTNFYRKVRELMGMSPNDYLRRCRMERAAELLRTTDLPVSDVCVQIGVPDAQYFSRVFKTFYGVTPTAYREQA
jgi:AraC-like DNA-binding protein